MPRKVGMDNPRRRIARRSSAALTRKLRKMSMWRPFSSANVKGLPPLAGGER